MSSDESDSIYDVESDLTFNTRKESRRKGKSLKENRRISFKERGSDIRAQHNAQERMRRDEIKECFDGLRDDLPCFQKGQSVSREEVLWKTAEYCTSTVKRIAAHKRELDGMQRYGKFLDEQIRLMEQALATRSVAPIVEIIELIKKTKGKVVLGRYIPDTESEDSSDNSGVLEDKERSKIIGLLEEAKANGNLGDVAFALMEQAMNANSKDNSDDSEDRPRKKRSKISKNKW